MHHGHLPGINQGMAFSIDGLPPFPDKVVDATTGLVQDDSTRDYSIEVLGESLRLHHGLPTSGGASSEIGMGGWLTVVALHNGLGGNGDHVGGAVARVDLEIVLVACPDRGAYASTMNHVGVSDGVVADESILAGLHIEVAAHKPAALYEEAPIPTGERKARFKADLRSDDGVDFAERW